jgi:peptidoglycan/LPS O-acetylase OafA/YrhL
VLGLALLIAALTLGRVRPVGPSVALLGLGYVLASIGRPADAGAVLYGTVLLAVAELAFWSWDLRGTTGPPPGAHRRRWVFIAAASAASIVLSSAVLLAGAATPDGGAGWEVAAVLAAVGAVGLLVGLARAGAREPKSPTSRSSPELRPSGAQ